MAVGCGLGAAGSPRPAEGLEHAEAELRNARDFAVPYAVGVALRAVAACSQNDAAVLALGDKAIPVMDAIRDAAGDDVLQVVRLTTSGMYVNAPVAPRARRYSSVSASETGLRIGIIARPCFGDVTFGGIVGVPTYAELLHVVAFPRRLATH